MQITQNKTLRPVTNASKILRPRQNFQRVTFTKEIFYTPISYSPHWLQCHSPSAGNYTCALGTIKTGCKTCTKLSFLCQQSQASEISTQPHTSYCTHFLTQSLFMFAVYITCGRVKMFTYVSRQYLSRHPML